MISLFILLIFINSSLSTDWVVLSSFAHWRLALIRVKFSSTITSIHSASNFTCSSHTNTNINLIHLQIDIILPLLQMSVKYPHLQASPTPRSSRYHRKYWKWSSANSTDFLSITFLALANSFVKFASVSWRRKASSCQCGRESAKVRWRPVSQGLRMNRDKMKWLSYLSLL